MRLFFVRSNNALHLTPAARLSWLLSQVKCVPLSQVSYGVRPMHVAGFVAEGINYDTYQKGTI